MVLRELPDFSKVTLSGKLRWLPRQGILSAPWVAFVGALILAWISLAPLAWISSLMLVHGRNLRAASLWAVGLPLFVWNQAILRRLLLGMYQEGWVEEEALGSRQRLLAFFVFQALGALACARIAGAYNPIGMQQWFWMPVSAFGGLMLRRRTHMCLLLAALLVVSTINELSTYGPTAAFYWMVGQVTTSVFILSCCVAVTEAARQRLKLARVAADLRAEKARLEIEADQASILAVAEERTRLAREIHDSVGHSLTVVSSQLEAADALVRPAPERASEAIRKALRASRDGLADIRRSVSNMRVAHTTERSLAESLTTLIHGAEKPGLILSLQQSGVSRPLPALAEISLYRCAQEGITNACRHAQAREICVHLDFTHDVLVSLSVVDDGSGFTHIPENSHGLKGLEERAVQLNGQFTAGTGPHGGGLCRMTLPG